MAHKRLYIDVETCGIDPCKHSMHQFAGLVEIDNKVVEEITLWIKPEGEIEPKALEVSRLTERSFDDQRYLSAADNYKKLILTMSKYVSKYNKHDKFHIVGYNCHSFDTEFVRAFFKLNQDKWYGSWFWHPAIDVMLIWAELLQKERHGLPNFKLTTLAKHLEIDVDENKAHDAMYDVTITREMYKAYKRRIKELYKREVTT